MSPELEKSINMLLKKPERVRDRGLTVLACWSPHFIYLHSSGVKFIFFTIP